MTLPEVLLWQALRGTPAGLRFRRQHPHGRYVLDFYCPTAKVAVEVEGKVHDLGDRPARDLNREAWLAGAGIKIIRVPATDVLKSAADVADQIVRFCSDV